MKPTFKLFTLISRGALLVSPALQAATNYSNTSAGNWATPGIWSGGVMPTGAFNQRINTNGGTTVTFGAAQETVAKALTTGSPSGGITIPGEGTFTLADFDLAGSIATLGAGSCGSNSFILNTKTLQFTTIPNSPAPLPARRASPACVSWGLDRSAIPVQPAGLSS